MFDTPFAPKRCTQEAFDADEQAHHLSRWQQEYDQLGEGRFYGRLDELLLPGLQVFKEHTALALRQQCRVWAHSLWIGLPAKPVAERINGQALGRDEVMCRPGGKDFELITPAGFDIYGIVVDREALETMAKRRGVVLDDAWPQSARHPVGQTTLQAVTVVLERLLYLSRCPLAEGLQRDLAATALLALLKTRQRAAPPPPSHAHRKAIVEVVKRHLDTHPDTPVTMDALCQLTHASRRTLQYSFTSILGISPLQFLRLTRLNRVRRALLAAEPPQTVTEIATYWGFYHLGQFARDYKRLFGEAPSQALYRH